MTEILDIVDENDQVIGSAPRDIAHRDGLLHRAIRIIFYTSRGTMILQRRSLKKEINPGFLSLAVAGHVTQGDDYLHTAQKETFEETGLMVPVEKFQFLAKYHLCFQDPLTRKRDNVFRAVYAYRFEGNIEDLVIEEGEAEGFIEYPIKDLLSIPESKQHEFLHSFTTPHYQDFFRQILEMIESENHI